MPPPNGTTPGTLTGENETLNADVMNPTTTVIGKSDEIGQLVAAVCKIMAEVGGIDKTQASGLNYKFLSEESMTTRLRGLMAAAGVMVMPRTCRVIEREDYRTAKGADMSRFLTRQTFIIAHTSGQWMEGETFGESSDSGDKCLNKCMTAAYKYYLRETFAISGGDDPDFHGGEAVARSRGYGADPRGGRPQGGGGNGQRQQGAPSGGGQNGQQRPQGNAGTGANPQQSNPNPDAAGAAQVAAALEQRSAACIGKIKDAGEHAQVDTLLRHAGTVQFTDKQAAAIRAAAAERKTAFWQESITAAADLEALDAIQSQVGGYLQPFPALAERIRAAAAARAEAIVSATDAAARAELAGVPGGALGADPFSDDPPASMDF